MKPLLLFGFIFLITLLHVKVYSPPTWKMEPDLEEYLRKELVFKFSNLNASTGSNIDKARALYYYVTGPTNDGYPEGYTGPSEGLFGIVNGVLQHQS
ncbi:MAG: hypothetical protein HRT44_10250, partial [Bdellovibrionales bacterium]|nr:hypothetical protein [Bdellovibrionales bacterium]NQZ19621.1 hypothetical protein [Bdellovibrionales bacterium]